MSTDTKIEQPKNFEEGIQELLNTTRESLKRLKSACDTHVLSAAEKSDIVTSITNLTDYLPAEFVKAHHKAINQLKSIKQTDDAEHLSSQISRALSLIDVYIKDLETAQSHETKTATTTAEQASEQLKQTVQTAKDQLPSDLADVQEGLTQQGDKLKQSIIQEAINKADRKSLGRLVRPYLESKYLQGAKLSQRYERGMSGVLMMLGLGDLGGRIQLAQKELTDKLKTLQESYKQKKDVLDTRQKTSTSQEEQAKEDENHTIQEDSKQEKSDPSEQKPDKLSELQERLHDKKTIEERKGFLRAQCEHLTGKKIDHVKFDDFISKRLDDHGQERQQLIDHYAKLKEQSKEGITVYNVLDEGFWRAYHETKAPFELFRALVGEGYLDPGSITLEQVEVGGKMIVRYGIAFGGLVYNGLSTAFGSMELNTFSEYVKDKLDIKLNEHSRMLLRGIMYRHGGLFTKAIATAGEIATQSATMILHGNKDALSKWNASISGGLLNKQQTQLDIITQLEKSMTNAGVFKGMPIALNDTELINKGFKPGMTHMSAMLEQFKMNTIITHVSAQTYTAQEFVDAVKKLGPQGDDILKNIQSGLKGSSMSDFLASGKQFKESLRNVVGGNTSYWTELLDKKAGMREVGAEKLGFKSIVHETERKMINQLKSFGNLQQSMIATNEWNILTKWKNKIKMSAQLPEMLKTADNGVLFLKKPEDVAEYLDEVKKTVARFPSAAKNLLSMLPVVMVGKEVVESIDSSQGISGIGAKILEGMGSLMPLVGPLMLLHSSRDEKDGKMQGDTTSMVLGAVMFTRDGVSMISQVGKGFLTGGTMGAGKAAFKGMLAPIRDVRNFVVGAGRSMYVGGRLMLHARELIAKDPKAFAKAASSALKRIGARAGLAGGIALGIGFLGYEMYEEMMADATIDETQKKLAKQLRANPQQLEAEIQKTRPTLQADQKAEIIRFALAKQLGTSIDMFPAGAGSATDHIYNLEVDPLGRTADTMDKKKILEDHLSKLEEKPTKIHLYFANTGRCIDQYKRFVHKELFGEGDTKTSFDPQQVEAYMLAQGFPQQALDTRQQSGSQDPMSQVFVG